MLSDVHGVLPALEAVLREPDVAGADLVVVTGDHTWGPQPAEVLDRLTGLGDRAVLVRGNADRELLQMARGVDVGLGDDPLSVWGATQLHERHQTLLEGMPEQVTLDLEGLGRVRFCHATPRDDEEVVLVDSRPERWAEVFTPLPDDVRTVVCGHTHMPFLRLVDRRLVVNPGSVGLPYGHGGASWALLSDGSVSFRRTPLDVDDLVRDVVAGSAWPGVEVWADETFRRPPSDVDALAAFGRRDGR